MAKYIIKRILVSLLTLWAMYTLTFLLMHAVPGGPFIGEKTPSAQTLANLNRKYGLDKPLIVQYVSYGVNAIKFDLGESIDKKGKPVTKIINDAFPNSLRLGLISVSIAVLFGTIFGIIGALKRNSWADRTVMFISTLGIAVPSFVVATVSIIVFAVLLKWVSASGLDTPSDYILPAFALSFSPLSYIARLTRSSMLDVVNQDYIRTARAKGLREWVVIVKHALRNAILPVVTYLGPLIATVITGTIVIEQIFAIPGLGRYFLTSISSRDYPVILGTTIFFGVILILMNFIVDLLYLVIDPRIKLED